MELLANSHRQVSLSKHWSRQFNPSSGPSASKHPRIFGSQMLGLQGHLWTRALSTSHLFSIKIEKRQKPLPANFLDIGHHGLKKVFLAIAINETVPRTGRSNFELQRTLFILFYHENRLLAALTRSNSKWFLLLQRLHPAEPIQIKTSNCSWFQFQVHLMDDQDFGAKRLC